MNPGSGVEPVHITDVVIGVPPALRIFMDSIAHEHTKLCLRPNVRTAKQTAATWLLRAKCEARPQVRHILNRAICECR